MQTHTFNTWEINEHPNKEACLEEMRSWPDVYPWKNENIDSLEGFCDYFSLSSLNWEVSLCGQSFAKATVSSDLAELRHVRLWTYLQNNFDLEKMLAGDCFFTGYCFDESLLDPLREFIKSPTDITYQDLIDDCLRAWVNEFVEDWESSYSDESLTDLAEVNQYQFDEGGNLH